jgi:endonuclease G
MYWIRLSLTGLFLISFLAYSNAQTYAEKIAHLEKEKAALEAKKQDLLKELEKAKLGKIHEDLNKIGLPQGAKGTTVQHAAMVLNYNEQHEQANWVAHIVTPDVIDGNLSRTNDFRPDPKVESGSALEKDYFLKEEKNGKMVYDGFGFDRGHLAPSADFRWSEVAISESYFYSNMSPQRPEFNRESWADLERWVRGAVFASKEQLIVITGPVLKEGLPVIERSVNKVSIPEQYYKVILDLEGEDKKAIAFLMPNKKCDKPVISYAVSIDKVEELTGLDFFANLEDALENKLEAMSNVTIWEGKSSDIIADVPPMTTEELPKNCISTADAPFFMNQEATVCGTVVSTKKTNSGSVFLNLDTKFPDQIFSVTIWAKEIKNFSYSPEIELKGKKVCVTGMIKDYKGTPTMNITNDSRIKILEE